MRPCCCPNTPVKELGNLGGLEGSLPGNTPPMDICTGCFADLSDGVFHMAFEGMNPWGPVVVLCRDCIFDLFPYAPLDDWGRYLGEVTNTPHVSKEGDCVNS